MFQWCFWRRIILGCRIAPWQLPHGAKKKAKTWQISGYWMPQQNHWFHHEKRRFEDLQFLEIDMVLLVPVLCQGPLAGIAAGRAGICCAVFRHISAVVFSLRRKDGHFFSFQASPLPGHFSVPCCRPAGSPKPSFEVLVAPEVDLKWPTLYQQPTSIKSIKKKDPI